MYLYGIVFSHQVVSSATSATTGPAVKAGPPAVAARNKPPSAAAPTAPLVAQGYPLALFHPCGAACSRKYVAQTPARGRAAPVRGRGAPMRARGVIIRGRGAPRARGVPVRVRGVPGRGRAGERDCPTFLHAFLSFDCFYFDHSTERTRLCRPTSYSPMIPSANYILGLAQSADLQRSGPMFHNIRLNRLL